MSDNLGIIHTTVPARLDQLPWSRWHWMIVIGLGTVWILDDLEVTIVGTLSGQISHAGSGVQITQSQITGPLLFAKLVGTGQVNDTVWAFVIGAVLMIIGGLVAVAFGVNAERRSLEDIAAPLSTHDTSGSGDDLVMPPGAPA